ncbi:hypothetical protein TTHERM_00138490 (macronuclear) [Tetrahymena thermophila SB210]|uniref:Uncharacterized protein n=1 Tax=Tetrahymena thermophila (strain SB210) TaxID=312017 RepID=I7MKM9_TETTS|nr:hypothetical protein TTHERM_00138490 [Tetrahymena thermophila SB210]EAR99586.2 hypothetical protein TTHERM_00138490 [Tetrahymena thermophila SB210]|eukprot:XP_001019831.2 hypothetical protein TTHERM_00138490 [Tetrahymena thermophila SB210]
MSMSKEPFAHLDKLQNREKLHVISQKLLEIEAKYYRDIQQDNKRNQDQQLQNNSDYVETELSTSINQEQQFQLPNENDQDYEYQQELQLTSDMQGNSQISSHCFQNFIQQNESRINEETQRNNICNLELSKQIQYQYNHEFQVQPFIQQHEQKSMQSQEQSSNNDIKWKYTDDQFDDQQIKCYISLEQEQNKLMNKLPLLQIQNQQEKDLNQQNQYQQTQNEIYQSALSFELETFKEEDIQNPQFQSQDFSQQQFENNLNLRNQDELHIFLSYLNQTNNQDSIKKQGEHFLNKDIVNENKHKQKQEEIINNLKSFGNQRSQLDNTNQIKKILKDEIYVDDQFRSEFKQFQDKNLYEDYDEQQLKRVLYVIFIYYSSYGERNNVRNLKSSKFIKMMNDCGFSQHQQKFDLIFFQSTQQNGNKHYADFDRFLIILNSVSNIIFQSNFTQLYVKHLKPLYEKIIEHTEYGQNIIIFFKYSSINWDQFHFSPQFISLLYDIYQQYFIKDVSSKIIKKEVLQKENETQCSRLLKDLDFLPGLISVASMHTLFQFTFDMNPQDLKINQIQSAFPWDHSLGKIFTISKFIFFLIICTSISQQRLIKNMQQNMNIILFQDLINLICERVISRGFNIDTALVATLKNQIKEEINKDSYEVLDNCQKEKQEIANQYGNHRLISEADTLFEYSLSNQKESKSKQMIKTEESQVLIRDYQNQTQALKKSKDDSRQMFDFKNNQIQNDINDNSQNLQAVLDSYSYDLKEIYNQYIDKVNKLLKKLSFKEFLKDSQLDQIIPSQQIEIIFFQCKNSTNSLNFKGFLQSIEKIFIYFSSQQDQNLLDQANYFEELIKQFILPINNQSGQNKYISLLQNLAQNADINQVLNSLQTSFPTIFQIYSSSNNKINFKMYIKFFSEFEVFPTYISFQKLQQIFKTLVQYQSLDKENQIDIDNQVGINFKIANQKQNLDNQLLNLQQFLRALLLVSLEVSNQQEDSLSKFVTFLRKINENKIIISVSTNKLKNIDILKNIPQKFLNIF